MHSKKASAMPSLCRELKDRTAYKEIVLTPTGRNTYSGPKGPSEVKGALSRVSVSAGGDAQVQLNELN